MSDTISNFIEVSDKSIFNAPSQLDQERFNFVSYTPVSGTSWTASQNIEVRINSSNELIDWSRSYIRGNFKSEAEDAQLSSMGVAACFKTLTESISGYSLPIQHDINLVKAVENKLVTSERLGFINVTESANSGTIGSTLTNFAFEIPGILSSSARYMPLPIVSGGITYNFELDTNAKVFKAGTSPTFTISDFSMVLCMVTPSANYLSELASGYARGNALRIPVEMKKVTHTPAISLTDFTIPIQCGFLRSVNSIAILHRPASVLNSTTGDAFGGASALLTSTKELEYWNLQIDSITYPRNRFIYYQNKRPEHLMQGLLCGSDVGYSALNAPGVTDDFLYYNFKSNSSYNAGLPTQTGYININFHFKGAPASTDIISSIISYDGSLILQNGTVDIVFN